MRNIRKLIGVAALVIAVGLAGLAVVGDFGMAGFQAGLVLFCGLGGMFLVVS